MELKNTLVWRANGIQLLSNDAFISWKTYSHLGLPFDLTTNEAVLNYVYKVKIKFNTLSSSKIMINLIPDGLQPYTFEINFNPTSLLILKYLRNNVLIKTS